MTKKILSVISLFFIFLNVNRSFSQCIPNTGNTALITPDTTTNFASGTDGVAYSQIVYVHPPTDTTAVVAGFPVTVDPVDSIVLNSITNLPPGLSYVCNPSNCVFLGGVSGCIAITGTPTTPGYYQLQIIITAYGKIQGTSFAVFATDTVNAYHININVNASVPQINQNSNFQLLEIGKNQVPDFMTLKMNSPVLTSADFSIFNILGKNVYSKPALLKQGINSIDFSTKNLSPGVYILTLKKEPYVLLRRFVIGGK